MFHFSIHTFTIVQSIPSPFCSANSCRPTLGLYKLIAHHFKATDNKLATVLRGDWESLITMLGNQLIALLIGILLVIVSIGWLIFCWYRRHVHMGFMISQARARVLRERQHGTYDVERGYHDSDHLVPKYTRGGLVRPKPRSAHGPRTPEYVVLRRLDGPSGLDYRGRSFRHAGLYPVAESHHPASHRQNEQPQVPQEQEGPEHAQEQPQQKQGKGQKKKQKQKQQKGNQGNQENKDNQSSQNNQGSHVNQGHQNNPPKGKKNKKWKNKSHQEEPSPQPQGDHQHENLPDNQGPRDPSNDYHGQQDGQSNHYHNGSRHSQRYRGNSDHGSKPKWSQGQWSDNQYQSPPVSDKNRTRGSNRGSQTGNSQNGHSQDRRSRGQGGFWDDGQQQEPFSWGQSDRGSRARVGEGPQEQLPPDAPW